MASGSRRNRRRVGVAAGALVLASCAGGSTPSETVQSRSASAARIVALPGPVRLVGMRADTLDALFGRPDLERQERRARYRRYDVDGCAVDLYLYESPSNGAPMVAWFEVRPVDPFVTFDSRFCAWLEERLGAPSASERRAAESRS